MEQNTNTTEQITQAENMGNEAQGIQGKKTFTQEEVNGFVQSRVSRMKGQIEKEAKAEYEQKMAELQAREMRLLIVEELSTRDMPKELADIITCVDEKDLKAKLDTLQKYMSKKEDRPQSGFRIGAPSNPDSGYVDATRKAFGLK